MQRAELGAFLILFTTPEKSPIGEKENIGRTFQNQSIPIYRRISRVAENSIFYDVSKKKWPKIFS